MGHEVTDPRAGVSGGRRGKFREEGLAVGFADNPFEDLESLSLHGQ